MVYHPMLLKSSIFMFTVSFAQARMDAILILNNLFLAVSPTILVAETVVGGYQVEY